MTETKLNIDYETGYELLIKCKYQESLSFFEKAEEMGYPPASLYLGWIYSEGHIGEKNKIKSDQCYQKVASNIEWFKTESQNGLASAQRLLGFCYFNGIGVEKDLKESAKYYQLAAEQGDSGAQRCLGVCYATGEGIEKDNQKAVYYFKLAADQGHVDAQYCLAACYEAGEGIEKDITQAIKYYQLAADQGHVRAQFELGQRFANGTDVDIDLTLAYKYYQLAANQGHVSAQLDLGICYEEGRGVEKDIKQALKYYQLAADQGNADAQYYFAVKSNLQYTSEGNTNEHYGNVVKYLQYASDQGHMDAQYLLGTFYTHGEGVEKDLDMGFKYFQLAADQGHVETLYYLFKCYESGNGGVEKDLNKAVKYLQLAADQGHVDALHDLANYYNSGLGVDKDTEIAVKYYQLAADKGHMDSQFILAAHYVSEQHKNISQAVKYFKLAADQGHTDAQCGLAAIYADEKDLKEAVKYFQLAADKGHIVALCCLATCYNNGDGVEKDIRQAIKYYQLAADQGNADAYCSLAVCYTDDDGEKDYYKAVKCLKKAIDQTYVNYFGWVLSQNIWSTNIINLYRNKGPSLLCFFYEIYDHLIKEENIAFSLFQSRSMRIFYNSDKLRSIFNCLIQVQDNVKLLNNDDDMMKDDMSIKVGENLVDIATASGMTISQIFTQWITTWQNTEMSNYVLPSQLLLPHSKLSTLCDLCKDVPEVTFVYQCIDCKTKFSSLSSMNEHTKEHTYYNLLKMITARQTPNPTMIPCINGEKLTQVSLFCSRIRKLNLDVFTQLTDISQQPTLDINVPLTSDTIDIINDPVWFKFFSSPPQPLPTAKPNISIPSFSKSKALKDLISTITITQNPVYYPSGDYPLVHKTLHLYPVSFIPSATRKALDHYLGCNFEPPTITVLPTPQINVSTINKCKSCAAIFSFWEIRKNCNVCGHTYCSKCLQKRKCPVYGYFTLVPICKKCFNAVDLLECRAWFDYLEMKVARKAPLKTTLSLTTLLHDLFSHVVTLDMWIQTGKVCSSLSSFTSALCFCYGQLPTHEWIKFVKRWTKNHSYEDIAQILKMKFMYTECEKSDWVNLARHMILKRKDFSFCQVIYAALDLISSDWLNESIFWFTNAYWEMSWQCLHNYLKVTIVTVKQTDTLRIIDQCKSKKVSDIAFAFQFFRLVHSSDMKYWLDLGNVLFQEGYVEQWSQMINVVNEKIDSNYWSNMSDLAIKSSFVELGVWCLLRCDKVSLSTWISKAGMLLSCGAVREAKICLEEAQKRFSDELSSTNVWIELQSKFIEDGFCEEAILCTMGKHGVLLTNDTSMWEKLVNEEFKVGHIFVALLCMAISSGISSQETTFWIERAESVIIENPERALLFYIISQDLAKQTSTEQSKALLGIAMCCQKLGYSALSVDYLSPIFAKYSSISIQAEAHLLAALCFFDLKQPPHIILEAIRFSEEIKSTTPLSDFYLNIKNFLNKEVTQLQDDIFNNFIKPLVDLFSSHNYPSLLHHLVMTYHSSDFHTINGFRDFLLKTLSHDNISHYDKGLLLFTEGIQKIISKEINEGVTDMMTSVLYLANIVDNAVICTAAILCDEFLLVSQIREFCDKFSSPNFINFIDFSIPNNHCYIEDTKSEQQQQIPEGFAEAALWYCDRVMVGSHLEKINYLVVASYYFVLALEKAENISEKFAYKESYLKCIQQALQFSKLENPAFRMYVSCFALGVALKAISSTTVPPFPIWTKSDLDFISDIVSLVITLVPQFPIITAPTNIYSDNAEYINSVMKKLMSYLIVFYENDETKNLRSSQKIAYYTFEGAWNKWLDIPSSENESQRENFLKNIQNSSRIINMDRLLNKFGWTNKDLEANIQWPVIPRTKDGWLLPTVHKLTDMEFSRVDGFSIDFDTGQIEIFLQENDEKLFRWKDIKEVLSCGIGPSIFCFDKIDSEMKFHPFQQMKYTTSNLTGTDFLKTLIHVTTLLEFFTMGCEVSSVSPFMVRSVDEGLLNRLPEDLKKVVSSVHTRQSTTVNSTEIHRFWIEAENILIEEKWEGNKYIIYFDHEVNMTVKNHLLINKSGKIEYTPYKIPDDLSPESEFCRDFTKNYNAIGKYFPEFLRLRELMKLAAMYEIINGFLEEIPKEINQKRLSFYEKILTELRDDTQNWPLSEDKSYIDGIAICNLVLRLPEFSHLDKPPSFDENNIFFGQWNIPKSKFRVSEDMYSDMINRVKVALVEKDQDQINNLEQNIKKIFKNIKFDDEKIRDHIMTWLRNKDPKPLAKYIVHLKKCMNNEKHEEIKNYIKNVVGMKLTSTMDYFKNFNFNTSVNNISPVKLWIPAVMCKDKINSQPSVCYCAVNLCFRLQPTKFLIIVPPSTVRVISDGIPKEYISNNQIESEERKEIMDETVGNLDLNCILQQNILRVFLEWRKKRNNDLKDDIITEQIEIKLPWSV